MNSKPSAVGAKNLSPALHRGPHPAPLFARDGVVERWGNDLIVLESRRNGTNEISCAVPTALRSSHQGHPALKRWAKIYRPARRDCFSARCETVPVYAQGHRKVSLSYCGSRVFPHRISEQLS